MRERSAVSTTNLPEGTKRQVETDHQYVLKGETRKATEKKRRPTSMPENYKKRECRKRSFMRSLAPTHSRQPKEEKWLHMVRHEHMHVGNAGDEKDIKKMVANERKSGCTWRYTSTCMHVGNVGDEKTIKKMDAMNRE